MVIIYYDNTNVDHILFCLLYNEIHSDKKILFVEYQNLFEIKNLIDANGYDKQYTVIFLEHLPYLAWYTFVKSTPAIYNCIKEFIIYTNKQINTIQSNNTNVIENIFDDTIINYNKQIHTYIYCNSFPISAYLKNKSRQDVMTINMVMISSWIYYFQDSLFVYDYTKKMNNYFKQYVFRDLFYGQSMRELIKSFKSVVSVIDYMFHNSYQDNIGFRNVQHNFEIFYKNLKYNIVLFDLQKKFNTVLPNRPALYTNEPVSNGLKVIQCPTLDFETSIKNHNTNVTLLFETKDQLQENFNFDFIEYKHIITNQSVFVPSTLYINNVSNMNIHLAEYYSGTNNWKRLLLVDYFINSHNLSLSEFNSYNENHITNLSVINPLLSFTIDGNDSYRNIMNNLIREFNSTNLQI